MKWRARSGLSSLTLILLCAACVGDAGDADRGRMESPSQHASSIAPGDDTLPSATAAIDLECASGTNGLTPGGKTLHGVATHFFDWQPGTWKDEDLRNVPTLTLGDQRFYLVKSPIYVFGTASARTQITLLSPTGARLYYTDWATWGRQGDESEQLREIAENSSPVVRVRRCGKEVRSAPGVLLLEGPACVTFRVTGQEPRWETTRTVPFYKEQC